MINIIRKIISKELILVFCIAVLMTVIFFREYFFNGLVPFPANLLMSNYSPWRYELPNEYPSGLPNKPIGMDNIRQFYPNRIFTADAFNKFRLPLWNPYIYSGTPYLAAFDTQLFYPIALISYIFSNIDGWSFMVVIQPILSMVFMYLFLKSINISKISALFGSIIYSFSGWMIVYWEEILVLQHSFLWLPLALYGSSLIWKKIIKSGLMILVLSLSFSLFAGFLQMTIYVWLTVLIWNVYLYFNKIYHKDRKYLSKYIIVGFVISLVITSVQWLPSLEAFRLSSRGSMSSEFVFRDFLLPFKHLLTLIAPDFWGNPGVYSYFGGLVFYFEKMIYMGVLPLIFGLYGMITLRTNIIRFWCYVSLVSLSLAFALPTSWLPYILKIPVLSTSHPVRIVAVFIFSFCIVASSGLDNFIKTPDIKKMKKILIIISAIIGVICFWLGLLWLGNKYISNIIIFCSSSNNMNLCQIFDLVNLPIWSKQYISVSARNLFLPVIFIVFSSLLVILHKYKILFTSGLFILTIGSSMYFANKYLYFSDRKYVYPESKIVNKLKDVSAYSRIWGYGNAFIEKNLSQYFGLYSTDGYGYLSPRRYGELMSTINTNGILKDNFRRSDTDLFEASEKEPLGTTNPYRLRMMELLGVKYILETTKGDDKDKQTMEDRFPLELFTNIYEDSTWRIWEYKKALPRAFIVNKYIVKKSDQEIVDALYDTNTDLTKTAIIEDKVEGLESSTDISISEAKILSYEPEKVVIETNSSSPGILILTDNYYPGWRAYIDENQTEIYRTNYSFRGVFIPSGIHKITFIYNILLK